MKHIYVDKSPIAGRGLFIGQAVPKGGLIAFIKGNVHHKVNAGVADALANPNWIGIGPNTWLDPHSPFKFINHSCSPSASIRGKVSLVALRALREGDEVTIDYSLTEEDPRWRMDCRCGSKNCRKNIRAIDSLSVDRFKAYLPNIPTHFRGVYLKSHRIGQ